MKLTNVLIAGLVLAGSLVPMASAAPSKMPLPLDARIRRELIDIPYLSVFDNLSFREENGVVTLMGQVRQPYLKDDAEKGVKRLEGVKQVVDNIEVLPLSPMDDGIRIRTLRALERTSPLSRYFMGVNPSIRIIVRYGRVTLDGVVLNAMDKQLAFMAANQVPNVFAVTNNLQTEH